MMNKNKVRKEIIVGKDKTAVPISDQPQHPESSNGNILLDSIQENYIAQSATLSTVTRTTTMVILGTVWAICYNDQKIEIPNIWLLLSLISSMIFLVVEIFHYLVDSVFYYNKSEKIVKSRGNFDFKKVDSDVKNHSKYSFCFLISKAIIVLSLCVIFLIGIIKMYKC